MKSRKVIRARWYIPKVSRQTSVIYPLVSYTKGRKVIKARWYKECYDRYLISPLATCPPHNPVRKSCYQTQCTICKVYFSDISHKMGSYIYNNNCKEVSTCSACGATASRTDHRGYKAGSSCTSRPTCDCGSTYVGSAPGHSWVNNHHADANHPHQMIDKCSVCGQTRWGTGYASWSWSKGSWYSISSSQHKRVLTCSRCSTQSSETEAHGSWKYGSWYSISQTQHKRVLTCGTCGYETSEQSNHNFGAYVAIGNCTEKATCSTCGTSVTRVIHKNYSGGTCQTPARCECGQTNNGVYGGHNWIYNHHASDTHPHYMENQCQLCKVTQATTVQAPWNWNYGNWYSIDGTYHKRVLTCSKCSTQTSEQQAHGNWSYGSWYSLNSSEHKRTKTCGVCSYLSSETQPHSMSWGSWYEDSSANQCKSQGSCGCGYTAPKWKSHSYSSWSYGISSATNCKKYSDCSDCGGGRTYQYPAHSFGAEYVENRYRKIKCNNCGYVKVLGEDIGGCTHPNATWGAWYEGYVNTMVSYCIREKKCPACYQVLDSETKEHEPSSSGTYEPYNEKFHYEIGTCRCGKTTKKTVAHNFVNGVCVCGAIDVGGGGGGSTVKINSFTAKASPDGDYINCFVSATGAVRYTFNLFVWGGAEEDIISSSGLTTSTFYQFSSIPGKSYFVSVTASDAFGRTDVATEQVDTPWAMPRAFKWTNPPTKGKNFNDSITASDWSDLQTIINAWRNRDMLYVYGYTTEYVNENSFIMAKKDKTFTYHYFNQIINALSEISHLSYPLPKRKTANPKTWLAQDFLEIEKAVNSLRS